MNPGRKEADRIIQARITGRDIVLLPGKDAGKGALGIMKQIVAGRGGSGKGLRRCARDSQIEGDKRFQLQSSLLCTKSCNQCLRPGRPQCK